MTTFPPRLEGRFPADYADVKRRLATLEQQMNQALSFPLGAWTPYTPAWTATTTNPTNGVITGRYGKYGRLVIAAIDLLMGSSTTFGTGAWRLSLPFTTNNPPVNYFGSWYAPNFSTAGTSQALNLGLMEMYTDAGVVMDATHPGTWAAGNQLNVQIVYESDS